jgi:hypothetical protein
MEKLQTFSEAKMLSIQQTKEDVLSFEKKLSNIFINKLIWEAPYVVPNVCVSKNKLSSQSDINFDISRFEEHLGSIYKKYLEKYPQEENKFSIYKKYYDKHKLSI